MEKPIDKLQILRERFEKEKKIGDLSEATRRAKVSNPAAASGLARKSWNDLTKAERKALIHLQKILNERKKEEEELEAELLKQDI